MVEDMRYYPQLTNVSRPLVVKPAGGIFSDGITAFDCLYV